MTQNPTTNKLFIPQVHNPAAPENLRQILQWSQRIYPPILGTNGSAIFDRPVSVILPPAIWGTQLGAPTRWMGAMNANATPTYPNPQVGDWVINPFTPGIWVYYSPGTWGQIL